MTPPGVEVDNILSASVAIAGVGSCAPHADRIKDIRSKRENILMQ